MQLFHMVKMRNVLPYTSATVSLCSTELPRKTVDVGLASLECLRKLGFPQSLVAVCDWVPSVFKIHSKFFYLALFT